MKRREFIGITAASAAAIMGGGLLFREIPVNRTPAPESSKRLHMKMKSGCVDARMNDGLSPGFIEREILANWV